MCKTHNSQFGTCSANPLRSAKNTQASRMSPGGPLGASWGLIWAIWVPSGGLVGPSRGLMGAFWQFKNAYTTSVKHTNLDFVEALLTLHEAPRIYKPHECHLEGSWEHLGASCGPSGSHLGVLWELPGALSEPSGSRLGVLWELKGSNKKLIKRV